MNFKTALLLSYICLLKDTVLGDDSPTVKTKLGVVRGTKIKTSSGRIVNGYLGIPYGKAPIGDLRFKYPVPVEPWKGIINATEYGFNCMQNGFIAMAGSISQFKLLKMSSGLNEDCLNLNVLVPEGVPNALDVMIYIHGGAFAMLSSSIESTRAREMVTEADVIFVSMNYRLGPMGFLYMDHPEIQPNQGLMDQLLAINWVKENIAAFGGDPNKITLAGVSAGSISIGYHLISPLSKGLFHRAIMESGSALYALTVTGKDEALNTSSQLASFLGCSNVDKNLMVKCMKEAEAEKLIDFFDPLSSKSDAFFPIQDGKFLIKHPSKSYQNKEFMKVDLLTGFNLNEGTFFLPLINPEVFSLFEDEVNVTLEVVMKAMKAVLPEIKKETVEEIKKVYGGNRTFDSDVLLSMCDNFGGDFLFKCGNIETANLMASAGKKVFAYLFNYTAVHSAMPKWMGVTHVAESIYAMGNPMKGEDIAGEFTEDEKAFSRRIIHAYGNFMRTGDPNKGPKPNPKSWITWPEFTTSDNVYLNLAPHSKLLPRNLRKPECSLINKIIKDYHLYAKD